jgi:hypothetical protein
MSLIANAADRLLSVIVPHATADAWSCPSGCSRQTCTCSGGHWYDSCVKKGNLCTTCRVTTYTC